MSKDTEQGDARKNRKNEDGKDDFKPVNGERKRLKKPLETWLGHRGRAQKMGRGDECKQSQIADGDPRCRTRTPNSFARRSMRDQSPDNMRATRRALHDRQTEIPVSHTADARQVRPTTMTDMRERHGPSIADRPAGYSSTSCMSGSTGALAGGRYTSPTNSRRFFVSAITSRVAGALYGCGSVPL